LQPFMNAQKALLTEPLIHIKIKALGETK
jgi:hypothetical protein